MIELALRLGQCGYGSHCPGAKDGSVCAGPETHPPDLYETAKSKSKKRGGAQERS